MKAILRPSAAALLAALAAGALPGAARAQSALQDLGLERGAKSPFAAPLGRETASVLSAQDKAAATFAESDLLNQQWKAVPAYTLGGIQVRISGLFTRDKARAFLVLYSPTWGKTPLLFNLRKLVSNEADIHIGDTDYRIYVDPSVAQLDSTVKIESADGKAAGVSLTLRDIMQATYNVGKPVSVSGGSYRLFLVNEVDGNAVQGKLNRSLQTVVLLRTDPTDEFDAFSFNHEDMPSDQPKDFPLENGRNVGFRVSSGTLEVYSR